MRRQYLILGCLALLFAFCCVIVVPIVVASYQLRRSLREFPRRHGEATEFIESTYRYYMKNGKWPVSSKQSTNELSAPPAEWGYTNDPESIFLYGPYHMALVYYFEPPKGGSVRRKWILSVEGNKTEFDADIIYCVDGHKEGRSQ
jgi:hypothetical protein